MNPQELKKIIEAAILSAGEPLTIERLLGLFDEETRPSAEQVVEAMDALRSECAERGVELVEVSSGYRYQARKSMAPWVSRLWEEKAPRYSRAFLETLALIAYRQPITRAEIEDIRGVSVASNIVKSLTERGWVRVVGHRDVPGRPAMYATTREFLDYFNLRGLDDLPTLAELRDVDKLNEELFFDQTVEATDESPSGERPLPAADAEPFSL